MPVKIAIAIMMLLFSNHLFASNNGTSLLRNCEKAINMIDHSNGGAKEMIYASQCLSMIQGVRDALDWGRHLIEDNMNTQQKILTACIPQKVSNEQLIRIVQKYLRKNPAKLHERDGFLVIEAILDVYSCAKN